MGCVTVRMARRVTWLLAASLAVFFSACGGGGGGGGVTQVDQAAAAYKGVATAAAVTPANAESLALGGFTGGKIGSTVGSLAPSGQPAAATAEGDDRLRRLTQVIKKSIRRMEMPRSPAPAHAAAPKRAEQFQVPGPDGGYASVTLNINDSTGGFSGTIAYQGYTSQGIVLSGTADVAGTYDSNHQNFSRFTLSFTALSMRIGTSEITLIGTLSWGNNFIDFSETLTMNMVLVDGADARTYWYRNYEQVTRFSDTSLTQTCSGRYYDPDHGYVDLTTGTPLVTDYANAWPSQGALEFAGKDRRWVRLTFLSFRLVIAADTDGDGTGDWQAERPTNVPPVLNSPPVANAGSDQRVPQGTTVLLDGSASHDPDGDPLSYSWQFQSCPQDICPGLGGNGTAAASFPAARAGTYVVGLTVYDGQSASPMDTVTVTSSPVVPSDNALLQLQWQYGMFGTSIGRAGLLVSDLDRDGTPEIIASASTGGFGANSFWYVVRRIADGSYDQIWRSENHPANIVRIAAADVDRDGNDDVVVGTADGVIHIYDGPTLREVKTLACALPLTSFAIGDLEADGTREIVTSDGTGVFAYSAESGTLKWSIANGGGSAMAVGNVDADAALEIVTTTYGGRGTVIDGVSRTVEWDYIDSFGALVALGDLDGDGLQEIVGASAWYKVTVFDADRKTPTWEIPTNLDIGALLVADADGDGVPEILYGDGQWGRIHAIDAATRTQKWSVNNPEHGVSGIALGDVDKDGRSEVVWGAGGTSTGPDHLYVADPSTGAIEWQNVHVDGPLSAVDVGDVDDDGVDEIVMVSFESDSGYAEGIIHIFDARTHALEYRAKLGIMDWMGVRSVRIADVDGDGRTEFVVTTANVYDGVIRVYDGATRAVKRQSAGYSGNFFSALAIGDVDGDGKPEIVAGQGREHTGAKGVFLVVLDGVTLQEKWRSVDLGNVWGFVYDIKLADVDGDGRVDIVASLAGSRLIVYDGVTHDLKFLASHPARALEVADVDGDGKREILVGRDDGNIDVFDGSTFAARKTVNTFNNAPVDALRVTDLAGDGTAEWLVTGGGFLSVLSGSDQSLRWRSRDLSGDLGRHNHIASRDTDADGRKEVFLGSDLALYHFR